MVEGAIEDNSLQGTLNRLAGEVIALKASQMVTANLLVNSGLIDRDRLVANLREVAKQIAALRSASGLSTLAADATIEMADLIAAGGSSDGKS